MTDDRLTRLAALAGLIRDARLADLSQHVQSCARIEDRLRGLNAAMPKETEVSAAAMEAAALRHDRWAAPRRMALNEQLAAATARRIAAETQARAAFGRAQVLEQLRDKTR